MPEQAHNKTWEAKGPPPSAAHRRAGQIWDERVGTSIVRAHNWRRMAFALTILLGISLSGNIAQAFKQSVIPYLVEVESSGKVRLVGAVTEQEWSLTESAKLKQLGDWITNFRGLSSDSLIVKERLAYVQIRSTQAAQLQLDRHYEQSDPLEMFGKETRAIHIESTTKIAGSEQAFRVEWTEKVFGDKGQARGVERFVGEFHLSIVPHKDEEMLLANPLGVYVTFFDFDRKK
jgi:type IV secretory pathway TrbF-like protein